ncbi:MAG: HAD family hydrolase [Acidobacteriota bacterium]
MLKPAAFIDRDGTLIEEVNFLSKVEDLVVFPYTAEALKLLKDAGFLIVVVTNQSGIGRGLFNEAAMNAIHTGMQDRLAGAIDAFYFCPHLPDEGCECRKPGVGMINTACDELPIERSRSWMIGDKSIDITTGRNAGMKTAMVMTGYGRLHFELIDEPADIVADDLLEAVRKIV